MLVIIIFLLFCYLLGSVPNAYLFTSWIKGIDVREIGSGNVGATNTARALGFKYGVIVALLDILKGLLAVLLARYLVLNISGINYEFLPYLAGLVAILGHDFSIFLKFSGGKGVATSIGVVLGISPLIFLILVTLWILLVFITKYVSLASIISSMFLPVFSYILLDKAYISIYLLLMAILIIIKHHENISRLLKGKENKITRGEN